MDSAISLLIASADHFGALDGAVVAQSSPPFSAATSLWIASAVSAIALTVLMRPGTKGLRIAATVAGLAAFAFMVVEVLKLATAGGDESAPAGLPPVFPIIFAFIGLAGAVRMITHPRPVFAALYFILVVIATASMFLVLGAEFMAFALIIVYAGAILITYMFVLMLAQQSPSENDGGAWYDRVPREAGSAVVIGFIMLAALSQVYFSRDAQAFREDVSARTELIGAREAWSRLDSMPKLLLATSQEALELQWKSSSAEAKASAAPAADGTPAAAPTKAAPTKAPTIASVVRDERGKAIRMRGDEAVVQVRLADGSTTSVALPTTLLPDNGRQVGVDLVSKFPAGLEIAGVVLLMALFGAVVLARKQIELGEDERRELAGMRRFTVEGESGGSGGLR